MGPNASANCGGSITCCGANSNGNGRVQQTCGTNLGHTNSFTDKSRFELNFLSKNAEEP